jgi:hypothetical protein
VISGISVDDSQPLSFAPELCVEIVTDALIPELLSRRVSAYLHSGVAEVAIVKASAGVSYWTDAGCSNESTLGLSLSLSL